MSNSDLEAGFEMAEIGVFAANPDGGEDILYAYAHYKLSGDAAAVYVPPITSNLVEITHNIHVYIGELDNVTAILAKSSEYASKAAFEDHLNDSGNPHNVDAKAVGLGNVPNVTPENQQPVFSNTVTDVTTDSSGNKNLPNISNGEKMGSILQKIRSAITAFVSHINAKNPHGIKAETIGAAEKSHYHSATDINSGTMSIQRGGTGGSNAIEALENFGIRFGFCVLDTRHSFRFELSLRGKYFTPPSVFVSNIDNIANEDSLKVIEIHEDHFIVNLENNSGAVYDSIRFSWFAIGYLME